MSSNLYVGNLTFNTTSADLEALFAQHGEVRKAQVITDGDTGRSRGFGFVEMASSEAAEAAIGSLNGRNVEGRDLTVSARIRSRITLSLPPRPSPVRRHPSYRGRQRCEGCGHPREAHREDDCTVPRCSCVECLLPLARG